MLRTAEAEIVRLDGVLMEKQAEIEQLRAENALLKRKLDAFGYDWKADLAATLRHWKPRTSGCERR